MDVLNESLKPVDCTTEDTHENVDDAVPWIRTDEDLWCDIHHEDLYNVYYSVRQYCHDYCPPFFNKLSFNQFSSFCYQQRNGDGSRQD